LHSILKEEFKLQKQINKQHENIRI
jgi:hypothetical protein